MGFSCGCYRTVSAEKVRNLPNTRWNLPSHLPNTRWNANTRGKRGEAFGQGIGYASNLLQSVNQSKSQKRRTWIRRTRKYAQVSGHRFHAYRALVNDDSFFLLIPCFFFLLSFFFKPPLRHFFGSNVGLCPEFSRVKHFDTRISQQIMLAMCPSQWNIYASFSKERKKEGKKERKRRTHRVSI